MGAPRSKIDQKALGNAALDRYLATRPSLFLHRNLRTILDQHEEKLARSKITDITMNVSQTSLPGQFQPLRAGTQLDRWNAEDETSMGSFIDACDANVAERRRKCRSHDTAQQGGRLSQAANFQSTEEYDGSYAPRAVLVVKRVVLRADAFGSPSVNAHDQDSESDGELNWIHSHKVDKASTTCTITAWEDSNGALGKALGPKSATGTMSQHNGCLHVTFLDQFEFTFPTPLSTKHSSSNRSMPAIWLKIKISNAGQRFKSFITSDAPDTAPPPNKSGEYCIECKPLRVAVSLNTERFPCKYSSVALYALDPTRTSGQRSSIAMIPKLDMVLVWRARQKSTPLTEFNRATSLLFEDRPTQLPTPDASQDLNHDLEEFRITYLFQQTRRLIQNNLDCPLCQKDLGFTSFQRLHMHLRVHHHNFHFEAEDGPQTARSAATCKIVNISVACELPGKANGPIKDEVMVNWIAPRQPFDLDAYLAGESLWDEQPVSRSRKGRPLKNNNKNKKQAMLAAPRIAPKLPPEQVPDLVKRVLPSHAVPKVHHRDGRQIQFYRTASKKPLRAGELVIDSDDDVDDAWLLAREQQHLRRLQVINGGILQPLTEGEQEFFLDWNAHLNTEQKQGVNGDRMKREGVIRFARNFRQKLAIPDWRAQFEAKLQRLVKYRICDQIDVAYCLKEAVPGSGQVTAVATSDETTAMEDVDGVLQGNNEQDEVPYHWDLCVCGSSVQGKRGAIYCDNPKCPRDSFHMLCFDLKSRPPGWLCPECDHSTSDGADMMEE